MKPEIIKSIREQSFEEDDYWQKYEGLAVETSDQTIQISIDSSQNCCESWGHFSTNDDIQYFVGAEIRNIKLTDTSLNTEMIGKMFPNGLEGGGIQFVDIETDRGVLQYAVYNEHNGYYGHDIVIRSKQFQYDGCL